MPGEGSVHPRYDEKGRTIGWVAQLSIGSRVDRRYIRRFRRTEREAKAALEDLRNQRATGIEPSRQSLGSYLRAWLEQTVTPNVTPNTARGYADAIAHFDPIAHVPLADLRAEQIEATCNRMRATRYMGKILPPTDIGPASPKTVRNAQVMLRAALEQAVIRGHVRRNEAKLVKLRELPRARRVAMTREMAQAILGAIEGDRYEAAYALSMAALRESEVLGLSRADVDLAAGTVTIRNQLRGSGKWAGLAKTKTDASDDTIDLPAFVLDRLRSHIERTDPVALVFTTPAGYAVNGSWFTKHFQALLAAAGLPRITVHDLRSGAATLLAAMGAHPSMARDFLRHANVTTTLTHYTRTTAAQRKATAELLDEAVR